MALIPDNEQHRLQIAAGTIGRDRGHQFEKELAEAISLSRWNPGDFRGTCVGNRAIGNPAITIIRFIAADLGINRIDHIRAWWLGGLATSGLGDVLHLPNGSRLAASKSDVLVSIDSDRGSYVKGVSVKTCSKDQPTNDQLYFTTASAFSNLLRANNIPFTDVAENALKMFCGDKGFRPVDLTDISRRKSDPDRWFFEELPENGRTAIGQTLQGYQRQVTRVLLQLAYPGDPHPPEYLLHITRRIHDVERADLALFTIDQLIEFSAVHSGFATRPYQIRKGRFKGDPNIHLAPRFGFVQFQRGGQKQHPTQLQFNLQASYFDRI